MLGRIFINFRAAATAIMVLFFVSAKAQNSYKVPHNTLSFALGSASYYGDLSSYSRPIQSTLDEIRWNVGGYYTHSFGGHWSARLGLRYIRIAGNDIHMLNTNDKSDRYIRNLHFRNDIKELSVAGIYDFNKAAIYYSKRKSFSPYLVGGVSFLLHNPVAKTPTGDWVSLRPLGTEGQGLAGYDSPYKTWAGAITGGAGIKIKLNEKFDLGLEALLQYSLTDYLDDVNGKYANPNDLIANGSLSVTMANRSTEIVDAYSGKSRIDGVRSFVAQYEPIYGTDLSLNPFTSRTLLNFGSSGSTRGTSKLKDSYMTLSIHLIYHLPNAIRCPSY